MNFNKIFNKPEIDWTKVKLVKNSPCKNCKNQIMLRQQHPGNTWDAPPECNGCKERIDWLIQCLRKLEWYEKQEEKKIFGYSIDNSEKMIGVVKTEDVEKAKTILCALFELNEDEICDDDIKELEFEDDICEIFYGY